MWALRNSHRNAVLTLSTSRIQSETSLLYHVRGIKWATHFEQSHAILAQTCHEYSCGCPLTEAKTGKDRQRQARPWDFSCPTYILIEVSFERHFLLPHCLCHLPCFQMTDCSVFLEFYFTKILPHNCGFLNSRSNLHCRFIHVIHLDNFQPSIWTLAFTLSQRCASAFFTINNVIMGTMVVQ